MNPNHDFKLGDRVESIDRPARIYEFVGYKTTKTHGTRAMFKQVHNSRMVGGPIRLHLSAVQLQGDLR